MSPKDKDGYIIVDPKKDKEAMKGFFDNKDEKETEEKETEESKTNA